MTRPVEHVLEFTSRSPEQTRHFGMSLGRLLQDGDLICLQGDLGAGKTTLVQGIARGWGSLDAVSSPTFVLVNLYRRPDGGQLFHLDTYRLDSAPEAEQLDLDEMLSQGSLLIEWPERAAAVLPDERLWAYLTHAGETERAMRFVANGARYENLLAELSHAAGG
jgi:tRNA threonylcarbamoyladenosine biosynthesis protein TsaE